MRSIPRPLDREEWLQARFPYFNASDAATLLDRHPFKTLAEVITEKLDGPYLDAAENTAMRRGRHLEHAIASWYEEEHGVLLIEPTQIYVNGSIAATLDRRAAGVEDRAIEIKSTAKLVAEPERYWIDQCQLQMYAADLVAVDLVALDSSMQLQCWEVKRDDEQIEQLVMKAESIMASVRRGLWPVDVERSSRSSSTEVVEVAELEADTADRVAELAEVREQLRELRDAEDHLRKLVLQRLDGARLGIHEGRNIVRVATVTRRYVDQRRLRKDHPDIAAAYEFETVSTSLRVLK